MNAFITITGNSCSGKSSIADELIDRGWKTLYNYTTRPPRGDCELDSYIFLTDSQYKIKLANGDFGHTNEYQGYFYAMSSIIPEGNVVVVLTPKGREEYRIMWDDGTLYSSSFTSFFLSIEKDMVEARLRNRGDSEEDIEKRLKDDFTPSSSCVILNGAEDTPLLADEIEERLGIN